MQTLNSALIIGDAHGSVRYLRSALELAALYELDGVIVAGDFGYWSPTAAICFEAAQSEAEWGVPVAFLDGNHENHPALKAAVAAVTGSLTAPLGPVQLDGSLWYLGRGARFNLAGHTTVALGGAHSIDRASRMPGGTWFPDEVLSDADLARAVEGGTAEILLTHDAPGGWIIPGLSPEDQLPTKWQAELPLCHEHRERLSAAYALLQPQVVIHGHYHSGYRLDRTEAWGAVKIIGLDCDRPGWAYSREVGGHPSMVRVGAVDGTLVLDTVRLG